MLLPIKINIKPLSVNDAYRGRRFITPQYLEYKTKVRAALPDDLKIPPSPYSIHFVFGFSSASSDWDNCIKTTQDCIAQKYNFNDKLIKRGVVETVMVPKGKEFFEFKIETYTP